MVVADNPVNFESIHCCGFLHHVKPGFPSVEDVSLEYLIAKYNDESYTCVCVCIVTGRIWEKERKRLTSKIAIRELTNAILYAYYSSLKLNPQIGRAHV